MTTLRLAHVHKRFGAVLAVRGASLDVQPGRIHAVVGENGAGKSTLLKIAAGILEPDEGSVEIDGRELAPHTAAEAIRRGVAMVQQHFALIGVFSALENVVLGAEPTATLGRLDMATARASVEKVARDLGVTLPLDAPTESLGVGDRQRLEIARALFRDAKIIILDEPTAVLTPAEADALYTTLRRLADTGRAIVVVTHKLDEVQGHADFVTVVRKGAVVESRPIDRSASGELASLAAAIMGGEPPAAITRAHGERGEVRLALDGVSLGRALRGVTLEVRAGEIVGVAGVEGNGQRELVRVLAGLEAPSSGSVRIGDGATGRAAVVHEDRQLEGLVLDGTVRDNLLLGELGGYARFGVLDSAAMDREARARSDANGVQPNDLDAPARALSGGNQQKVVMARALARAGPGSVLVVAHPTRGVDLGATRSIHAGLLEAARAGAAVLVISADLHELRALSDRIVVMARGRLVASLPPESSDAEIGAAMLAAAPGAP